MKTSGRERRRARTGAILSEPDGYAMVSVILVLLLLATLGGASLVNSGVDLQSASHFRTARQAFFASESGILHALGTINARGVQDFSEDIADGDNWARLYGNSDKTMVSDLQSQYQIAVAFDVADPASSGTITSTGTSDMEARRTLRVRLVKGPLAGAGPLYLADEDADPDFGDRDQFLIDGNDHNTDASANPGGPVRPGVSTRNDDVANAAVGSLTNPQKERVRGLGFSLSPLSPSVLTTDGPGSIDLDQIVGHILDAQAVTEVHDPVLPPGSYGSPAVPQVTRLTNPNVRLEGSMSGAGILIADGSLTISGTADFMGWMIVRGDTILSRNENTGVDGNATILGSLWTGDLVIQVGGSAVIEYCEACMALADGVGTGNNVPRIMTVSSWQEVF